jgi:hypothetical protein
LLGDQPHALRATANETHSQGRRQIVIRKTLIILTLTGALGVAALVAVAAAGAIGNGSGAERVNATFAASAIGDPTIKTCAVTREGSYLKFTGDYSGRAVTDREEVFGIVINWKTIANVETGLGTAKGTFQLVDPTTGATVGNGELNAVFVGDPNLIGDPNQFGGELHGMMLGSIGDPNARTIIWLFSASLSNGGRTLSGAIGDPTLAPTPAILFPADVCKR